MACQKCKQKKTKGVSTFPPRDRWTKKMVNEVSLMYEDVFMKRTKTPEDWNIIFDGFSKIFPTTSITDTTNIRYRGIITTHLNGFYKYFVEIRKDKLK
tara:strand:+ start:1582 stop:1875 length:294 start_codon:yes stop_codon:yes gene_type:complete